MTIKTCAVLVAYNPDIDLLLKNLYFAKQQVEKIYVVDNGSIISVENIICDPLREEYISMGGNKGVAAGFNAGIIRAKKEGYNYVLLMDQDSCLPQGSVQRYIEVIQKQKSQRQRIAAIGPRYLDSNSRQISSFVRFNWFRNSYESGSDVFPVVYADFLISSGSFYEIEVFDIVGLFDEKLFIDHVDTEWCHRAASLGFKFLGVRDVIMEHSLGEGGVRLWFFRWRTHPIHKPFRIYYIARNSLLLYHMEHVPLRWISGDVLRLLRLVLVYAIFSPQRIESIYWFFRGTIDGLQNVVGPAPHVH